jgi:hypothetical protein
MSQVDLEGAPVRTAHGKPTPRRKAATSMTLRRPGAKTAEQRREADKARKRKVARRRALIVAGTLALLAAGVIGIVVPKVVNLANDALEADRAAVATARLSLAKAPEAEKYGSLRAFTRTSTAYKWDASGATADIAGTALFATGRADVHMLLVKEGDAWQVAALRID